MRGRGRCHRRGRQTNMLLMRLMAGSIGMAWMGDWQRQGRCTSLGGRMMVVVLAGAWVQGSVAAGAVVRVRMMGGVTPRSGGGHTRASGHS